MAVTSKVIEFAAGMAETTINTELTTLAIATADFIETLVLRPAGPNQRGLIIIFYNVP